MTNRRCFFARPCRCFFLSTLLLLFVLLFANSSVHAANSQDYYPLDDVTEHDCDLNFTQFDASKANYFYSDGWTESKAYADDEVTQCVYRFVAGLNQHVSIRFLNFTLHGDYPRCRNDYIDVYTDVSLDTQDLVDWPLHGRYCGDNITKIPQEFVSSGRVLIFIFYKDGAKKTAAGFRGVYRFFNSTEYEQAKRDSSVSSCRYLVDSNEQRTGVISSPNYPGVYKDNVTCTYLFRGQPGERVKLSFLDFDLFYGGSNCPYDYLKVYDGAVADETSLIGTYCGLRNVTELFSSSDTLLLEFATKSGRLEPLRAFRPFYDLPPEYEVVRRGFHARFRFGDDYVNIRSMENPAQHIRGTECDVLVQNSGPLANVNSPPNTVISSPHYPDFYPPNKLCRYYLQGKSHRQHLEKVDMTFLKFNIPRDSSNRSAICDKRHELQTNRSCRCDGGFLAIFTRADSAATFNYNNVTNANHVLCGSQESSLPNVTTDSKSFQVVLVLNTSAERGRFQIAYSFDVDFLIPGTMKTPRLCHFIYRSAVAKSGLFNSPRYGMRYPDSTTCTYEFFTADKFEQVRISFLTFHTSVSEDKRDLDCFEDYVELAEITDKEQRVDLGRYCDFRIPGPVITSPNARRLILTFVSDPKRAAQGFLAHYNFSRRNPTSSAQCGGEIVSAKEGGGGIITTPNYLYQYGPNLFCDWVIRAANANNQIMVQFLDFNIEGSIRSCAAAAMRIYDGSSNLVPSVDKCGTDYDGKVFMATQNVLRIRFVTGSSVKGRRGFKIIWTEVINTTRGQCDGFRCRLTGLCIDHKLECNGVPNCGQLITASSQQHDNSDENETCVIQASYSLVHVAVGVLLSLLLAVGMVAYIFYHKNRYQKRKASEEVVPRVARTGPSAIRQQPNESPAMLDSMRSNSKYSLGARSVSTGRKLADDNDSLGNERLIAEFPPPAIYNDPGREFSVDHIGARPIQLSHGDSYRRGRANGRGMEDLELEELPAEPSIHNSRYPHPQRVIVKEKLQKISIV